MRIPRLNRWGSDQYFKMSNESWSKEKSSFCITLLRPWSPTQEFNTKNESIYMILTVSEKERENKLMSGVR